MKVIRFELEGSLNSFRIPFFRTYHKSYLSPPKTTMIGMLCNISLKSQKDFFEILDKELIEVSIIINGIKGKAKDLWSYKTLEKKNMGKSVVRRDKLFIPRYTVYLKINNEKLYDEILQNLIKPKNIPSLGMDDELVIIKNINTLNLEKNLSNRLNCVFLDKGDIYKAYIKDLNKAVELPTANLVATKFIAFDKKEKRVSKEVKTESEFKQVEYLNCELEVINKIESLVDIELDNKLVFY